MRLEGKIAVVTGAAGGIGRATAQELALRGAKVIALDVDTKDGELTASIIRKEGGECTFIFMDVTDPSNVANVASTILREFGAVDILVNNAGIWRPGTILTLDVDSWASVFNTKRPERILGLPTIPAFDDFQRSRRNCQPSICRRDGWSSRCVSLRCFQGSGNQSDACDGSRFRPT